MKLILRDCSVESVDGAAVMLDRGSIGQFDTCQLIGGSYAISQDGAFCQVGVGVAAKGRIAAMRTKTAEGEEVVTQSILAGRFGHASPGVTLQDAQRRRPSVLRAEAPMNKVMNPYQLDTQGDTRYATLFSPTPSLSLKSVDTGDVEALNRASFIEACREMHLLTSIGKYVTTQRVTDPGMAVIGLPYGDGPSFGDGAGPPDMYGARIDPERPESEAYKRGGAKHHVLYEETLKNAEREVEFDRERKLHYRSLCDTIEKATKKENGKVLRDKHTVTTTRATIKYHKRKSASSDS
jgi:hypothetical protein